jgi:hypothetical protein
VFDAAQPSRTLRAGIADPNFVLVKAVHFSRSKPANQAALRSAGLPLAAFARRGARMFDKVMADPKIGSLELFRLFMTLSLLAPNGRSQHFHCDPLDRRFFLLKFNHHLYSSAK